MAMSKGQRIGMWLILFLMVGGTLASFAGMILQANIDQTQSEELQKAQEEQLKAYEEYQKKADEMAEKRAAASKPFDAAYAPEVFRASDVTELQKTDLVEGTGAVAEKGKTVKVSYFGWNDAGKIFDSSLQEGQENKPIEVGLNEKGIIVGWVEGIAGMKVGGVRKLAIPAAKAYGENRQSPLIGANAPLMFIVRLEEVK